MGVGTFGLLMVGFYAMECSRRRGLHHTVCGDSIQGRGESVLHAIGHTQENGRILSAIERTNWYIYVWKDVMWMD